MIASKNFFVLCDLIEKDKNFGTTLAAWDLAFIASTTLHPYDQAITLEAQATVCNLGKLYNVLQVKCLNPYIYNDQHYWVATKMQILIKYVGCACFYHEYDFEFQKPLPDLALVQFLNKSCLISENLKKSVKTTGREADFQP